MNVTRPTAYGVGTGSSDFGLGVRAWQLGLRPRVRYWHLGTRPRGWARRLGQRPRGRAWQRDWQRGILPRERDWKIGPGASVLFVAVAWVAVGDRIPAITPDG